MMKLSRDKMRVASLILLSGLLIFTYSVLSHHVETDKLVALTFDDGPDPRWTPLVLETLKRYKVRATFFVIGEQAELYPELVQRIHSEGHELGNHTYSHPNRMQKESFEELREEVRRCNEVIERITGVRPKLFRPPMGLMNYFIHTAAQVEGLTVVYWTVSADHHDAPTPQAMANRVMRLIHPYGIILMHDGRTKERWKDVKALPLIIEGLKKRGYHFVTVSELLHTTGAISY
jgi:peptidoglycan/xylan/chitin deacetylase (PgdA/CDA1 family)